MIVNIKKGERQGRHGMIITTDRPELVCCSYCKQKTHLKFWYNNTDRPVPKDRIVCRNCQSKPTNMLFGSWSHPELHLKSKDGTNIISFCAPILEVIDLKKEQEKCR